jgi:hypothetical protein
MFSQGDINVTEYSDGYYTIIIGKNPPSSFRNSSPSLSDPFSVSFTSEGITLVASHRITDSGTIEAELFDTTKNRQLLFLAIDGNVQQQGKTIHAAFPSADEIRTGGKDAATQVNMGLWVLYALFVKYLTTNKKIQQPTSGKGTASKNKGGRVLGLGGCCINHDMICSDPFANEVYVNFFGCDFTASVLDCCKQHDVDLWCGASDTNIVTMTAYLLSINAKFAACIIAKLVYAAAEQLPWYCGGVVGGLIIGFVIGLFVSAVAFLGTLGGGIYHYKDEFFPGDGRHNHCCLCGGDTPTAFCGKNPSDCRDMCKEMGMKQKCFNCHWKCNYNKGKFVGVSWMSDNKLPCCTGTQQVPCSRDEKTASSMCPTCYVCGWGCLYNENNKKWELVAQTQNEDGLLCCNGTPERDISAENQCENKNRKDKPWKIV